MIDEEQMISVTHTSLQQCEYPENVDLHVGLRTDAEGNPRVQINVSILNPGEPAFVVASSIANSDDLTTGIYHLWLVGYLTGIKAFAERLGEEEMEPEAPRLH